MISSITYTALPELPLVEAGVNDLGGTLMDKTISRSAGAQHGHEMLPQKMEALIRSMNRVPRQRTTLYGDAHDDQYRASLNAAALKRMATGDHQPVDYLAEAMGTIGYEVLTGLGHRYERNYLGAADLSRAELVGKLLLS